MDYCTELTNDDIDTLLQECNDEMVAIRGELGLLLIKKDMLNKKLREWQNEKEWLEILKDEKDFSSALVKVPHDTMKSIRARYGRLIRRCSKLVGDN